MNTDMNTNSRNRLVLLTIVTAFAAIIWLNQRLSASDAPTYTPEYWEYAAASHFDSVCEGLGVFISLHTNVICWQDAFDGYLGSRTNSMQADAPCPFPPPHFSPSVAWTNYWRFGRMRELPKGFSATETPMIWGLREYSGRIVPEQIRGKTPVIYWNGQKKLLSIKMVYNELRRLKNEHVTNSILV